MLALKSAATDAPRPTVEVAPEQAAVEENVDMSDSEQQEAYDRNYAFKLQKQFAVEAGEGYESIANAKTPEELKNDALYQSLFLVGLFGTNNSANLGADSSASPPDQSCRQPAGAVVPPASPLVYQHHHWCLLAVKFQSA